MHSTLVLTGAFFSTLFAPLLAMDPESISGFNVVWSDDFSGSSLDATKWTRFTGTPSNNEQETYPANSDNCKLSGQGSLLITPENNGGQWTSCRIESNPSFSATPGKQMIVQSRFKLGQSGSELQGIWPAFWSLGQSVREGTSWPACGEIDTFENINGQSMGYGTLHCGTACNDPSGLSQGMGMDYDDFHTWAHAIDLSSGDWTQQSITFYMDGQAYHVVKGSDLGNQDDWAAVAQQDMFMILNVAVGGGWPGDAAANTVGGSAAGMEVLYVGVYQSI